MSVAKQSKKVKQVEPQVPPPDASKKQKKPKAAVLSEPVVVAPVPVPVPEGVVSDNVVTSVVDTTISDSFSAVLQAFSDITGAMTKVKNDLKVLERCVAKETKVLDKIYAKKNKNKGTRAPSGFVKPTKISDELAEFLKKDKGTLMARTDVTKEMTSYIRENKLQDKDNGRKIIPDAKLRALLNVDEATEVTYFNLQKFMSVHFEKSAPKV